jgi:hypothetical protein
MDQDPKDFQKKKVKSDPVNLFQKMLEASVRVNLLEKGRKELDPKKDFESKKLTDSTNNNIRNRSQFESTQPEIPSNKKVLQNVIKRKSSPPKSEPQDEFTFCQPSPDNLARNIERLNIEEDKVCDQ